MKVFLSWSGQRSHLVAQALRDWLPGVLQAAEPWLSSDDIEKGSRWLHGLERALAETHMGIVCLTRENLNAAWLNFEAGAITKLTDSARLYLYNLDVAPSDVSGPLAQFQAVSADRSGTYKLLAALNHHSGGHVVPEKTLERAFDLWWPQLQSSLAAIPSPPAIDRARPTMEEKIDKILLIVEEIGSGPKATPSSEPETRTAIHATPESTSGKRPRAFIGSSTEGLPVANAIQESLDPVADCTIWNQGVFAPSSTYIESLQDARLLYDFAIVVMTPDDTTTKRGVTAPAPRDNLLFELGLFAGALGRARTFLVLPVDGAPRLPSDLSGVTVTSYRSRPDGNRLAALGPAMSQIKRAMGVEDAT